MHNRNKAAVSISLLASAIVFASAARTEMNQQADDAPSEINWQSAMVIELAVSDFDRSMEFYRDTLEFDVAQYSEELQWAQMQSPVSGVTIGLGEKNDVQGSGTISINIAVADIDQARATLEERGVEFVGPTITIPGVIRLADFDDPDGNRIRLAAAN